MGVESGCIRSAGRGCPEAPVTLEYVALWNSNLNQTAQVSNMWVVPMAKCQSVMADFGKPRLSVGLVVTPSGIKTVNILDNAAPP